MPQMSFTGLSPDEIIELIKVEYKPLKFARRGNVIWMVCDFKNGTNEIVAFLLVRSYSSIWVASRFQPRARRYVTCPSSYLDMCGTEILSAVSIPMEERWRKQVREYHKERGFVTSRGMEWKKKVRLGDVVTLNYRNLKEAQIVSLNPLKVQGPDKKTWLIRYHRITGFVSKSVREEDECPITESSKK